MVCCDRFGVICYLCSPVFSALTRWVRSIGDSLTSSPETHARSAAPRGQCLRCYGNLDPRIRCRKFIDVPYRPRRPSALFLRNGRHSGPRGLSRNAGRGFAGRRCAVRRREGRGRVRGRVRCSVACGCADGPLAVDPREVAVALARIGVGRSAVVAEGSAFVKKWVTVSGGYRREAVEYCRGSAVVAGLGRQRSVCRVVRCLAEFARAHVKDTGNAIARCREAVEAILA